MKQSSLFLYGIDYDCKKVYIKGLWVEKSDRVGVNLIKLFYSLVTNKLERLRWKGYNMCPNAKDDVDKKVLWHLHKGPAAS